MPSPAYTEQNGLFINLEGRLQKSNRSSFPPGISKEDWKIFNLLSQQLKNSDLFKNFNELRNNALKNIKDHSDYDLLPKTSISKSKSIPTNYKNENIIIKEIDYYFSNSIARSSKTMSDCRSVRSKNLKQRTGT